MRRTRSPLPPEIRDIVARIVRDFDPDRVILFGSHARGDATPDSDVDLLVVMPLAGLKRRKQLEIRKALRGISTPVDIVVSSPEELQWRKDVAGTIEFPAFHEGTDLYARE